MHGDLLQSISGFAHGHAVPSGMEALRANPDIAADLAAGACLISVPWHFKAGKSQRINITLDGVPLNDMEDQVLYFADLPDLMASVQSVQVQRGVGTPACSSSSFMRHLYWVSSSDHESDPVKVYPNSPSTSVTLA